MSGCYSTLDKKNIKEIPGIYLVIDNSEKDDLVNISLRKLNLKIMPSISTEPGEASIYKRGRNRAFIKIKMDVGINVHFVLLQLQGVMNVVVMKMKLSMK